jgi:hypothetical protein
MVFEPVRQEEIQWSGLEVLFYAPYKTNADIGSDSNQGGPAFVAGEGGPYALIIVPVGTHKEPSLGSAEKPSPDPQ